MTQQPQQIDLGGFMRSIERVSKRVDEKPRLSWATVVQSNPLRIQVDGHPGPLLDSPRNAASQVLLVGQRVQVALQDLRYTIVSDARVNDLRGTTAQRDELGASGAAVQGLKFTDVTDGRTYVWDSGWLWLSPSEHVSVSASTQSITAETPLDGMSLTVTLEVAQQLRFNIRHRSRGVAGAITELRLKDGGTTIGAWLRTSNSGGADTPNDHNLDVTLPISAGVHTFALTALPAIGSRVTSAPSVTSPNQFTITPA